ncbi:MAG: methyltransferase domain-containing protein [Alphaproteobacteria bacterium]
MNHRTMNLLAAGRGARADVLPFVRAWLNDPLRVGAALPSGTALASVITADISAATGPVIELGAGTGAFTRALLRRGVPEDQLVLVESSPEFASLLQARYRSATVLCEDAARLGRLKLAFSGQVGAVVSGLPVLSMPRRKVLGVLAGAFRQLRPQGAFYQFTYGPKCSVSRSMLEHLDLESRRVGIAWINVPPASVYRIARRPEPAAMTLAA